MNLTRSLVDNITDAVFIVDTNHKVVYANSAVREFIGKEPGEIINSYCYNVFTSSLCFKGCPFNYVTESRTSFTKLGVKIYDDVGNVKEVSYTAFPYRDDMVEGIAVTLRNADLPVHVIEPLTGTYEYLPHKRQFFNELIQEVGEGVVIVDSSFKIIEFNKIAEEITGFRKEAVYGQPCPNICSFTEEFSCPFDYCLRTNHDAEEALTNIIRKSGEPVVVKVKLKLVKDGSGKLLGGIALIKNIVNFSSDKNIDSFAGICGKSDSIRHVYDFVKAASISDYPILISGERGVGKDLVATTIHKVSDRAGELCIKINCAAFPEGQLEMEIFGAEKGGSNGNGMGKQGKLEIVGKGTIILDDINETSLSFQTKLFKLLEEGKYYKLGGEKPLTSESRLIFTTVKDLKKEVEKGNFREDLYYFLNRFHIHIPSLFERREDIPVLAEYFLKQLIDTHNYKLCKKVIGFDSSAIDILCNYDWKGNVMELKNLVESVYFMLPDHKNYITPEDLPSDIREAARKNSQVKNHNEERQKIINALLQCNLDKTKAAKLLSCSRVTLWRKMIYYQITPEELLNNR